VQGPIGGATLQRPHAGTSWLHVVAKGQKDAAERSVCNAMKLTVTIHVCVNRSVTCANLSNTPLRMAENGNNTYYSALICTSQSQIRHLHFQNYV